MALDPFLKQVFDGLPLAIRFPAHGLIAINQQGMERLQAGAELERLGQGVS